MGGAKALMAFKGAPHRPGTIYMAKASEKRARKNCGTLVRRPSSSCGKWNMPSR